MESREGKAAEKMKGLTRFLVWVGFFLMEILLSAKFSWSKRFCPAASSASLEEAKFLSQILPGKGMLPSKKFHWGMKKGWIFYSLLTLSTLPWASSSISFSPNEPGNLQESPELGNLRESGSTTGFGVLLSQDLGCQ